MAEQEVEPLDYEEGFHFQFVSAPAAPPTKAQAIKQWKSPSVKSGSKSKDSKNITTVLIESEGSDEEGIIRNIIMKPINIEDPQQLVDISRQTSAHNNSSKSSNKVHLISGNHSTILDKSMISFPPKLLFKNNQVHTPIKPIVHESAIQNTKHKPEKKTSDSIPKQLKVIKKSIYNQASGNAPVLVNQQSKLIETEKIIINKPQNEMPNTMTKQLNFSKMPIYNQASGNASVQAQQQNRPMVYESAIQKVTNKSEEKTSGTITKDYFYKKPIYYQVAGNTSVQVHQQSNSIVYESDLQKTNMVHEKKSDTITNQLNFTRNPIDYQASGNTSVQQHRQNKPMVYTAVKVDKQSVHKPSNQPPVNSNINKNANSGFIYNILDQNKTPVYYTHPVGTEKIQIAVSTPIHNSSNRETLSLESRPYLAPFYQHSNNSAASSGTLTLQKNVVSSGAHQVISSGPVILNNPGIISINSPVRHYIIPKLSNNPNSNPNISPSLGQSRPTIKVVKLPSSATFNKEPFNLNSQNNVKVKLLNSMTEATLDPESNIKTEMGTNESTSQETTDEYKALQPIDYPEFVQIYRPSHIKTGEQSVGIALSAQAKEDSSGLELQPFSLDFQNLLQQEAIQLESVDNIPCNSQRVMNINRYLTASKTNKQVNQIVADSTVNAQPKVKIFKSKMQNQNYTYVELNKAYVGKKSRQLSNFYTTKPKVNINKVERSTCFTYDEWNKSLRNKHVLAGFAEDDCKPRKCASMLITNINNLGLKLKHQHEKLQTIERMKLSKKAKKTYFKKDINYSQMIKFLSDEWFNDYCTTSETESAIDSDFLDPSTSSNPPVGYESDNDLLVTKKVVILNNGPEEENETKIIKKKKKRFNFMPPKGYKKKKPVYISTPKERPLDYRIYSKISAMKKLHNIRPCYVEIDTNQLIRRVLVQYSKNKHSSIKLTQSELRMVEQKEKKKEAIKREIKQGLMFMNWFNNKIISNIGKFKNSISSDKPLLIIKMENKNMNDLKHYKQFNIVFPVTKALPENLPRNKWFIQLVGLGHVKIVDANVLSEYFKDTR